MARTSYERSLFVEYLGDSPYIRVLDYFVMNDLFDCSMQDVVEHTRLSRNTARKVLNEMLKLDLLKRTRTIGRAKLYQINKSNPYVKYLTALDHDMTKQYMRNLKIKTKSRA
jgi:hypothetical protein